MNPIDSSKKWILNKLIPLIEKQNSKSISREDLSINQGEDPNNSHPAISNQDKNDHYSDLLEDSEYPNG